MSQASARRANLGDATGRRHHPFGGEIVNELFGRASPRSQCIGAAAPSKTSESGRPDSNRRPPRPKRGALTRLSHAPMAFVCAYSVTVCAHELALASHGRRFDDTRGTTPGDLFRDGGMHPATSTPRTCRNASLIPPYPLSWTFTNLR